MFDDGVPQRSDQIKPEGVKAHSKLAIIVDFPVNQSIAEPFDEGKRQCFDVDEPIHMCVIGSM